ncbi:MAG TPA: Hsp33 family molecular chaperone HslO [Lacunisphaera sp.]|nr:Hsp33 family molecular chaperone HslO [Lacunisphaera sp.]
MPDDSAPEPNGAVVTVDFVRHRNVLLVQGDLGPVFTDYYLHLADHHLRCTPGQDALFKGALAAFTLHCASRPRGEHLAWTANFQAPLLNLFLTGDNEDGLVAGRVFTDHVKESDHNVFYSDIVPIRGARPRRSIVPFRGADAIAMAEEYYRQSEQRPARYFDLGEDRFALAIGHPDCDERWLAGLDPADLLGAVGREVLARIEQRAYEWRCGCNHQRILATLTAAAKDDLMGLFGDDESVRLSCPRCAAHYVVTREALEAFIEHRLKQQGGA